MGAAGGTGGRNDLAAEAHGQGDLQAWEVQGRGLRRAGTEAGNPGQEKCLEGTTNFYKRLRSETSPWSFEERGEWGLKILGVCPRNPVATSPAELVRPHVPWMGGPELR